MRRLGFLFLIILFSKCFSQKLSEESSNSLLWEITKPGKQKGYLFGTIHLKDKRVFNFYDSLLPKISSCQQFAIEIDPEILVRGTFEMETKEDSVIDLREGANTKEDKDLEEKLEEELGFSLHKLNKKSMKALRRYFGGQKDKPDDKPTFLDGWLCDFAKRTGKKIRGLETIEGHMDGYKTIKKGGIGELDWETILSGKGKSLIEEMVNTYLSNDQNKIEQMYAKTAGEDELASLQTRNRAMAKCIDSLLTEGSLFSAVGSAHLAGKEGVIELLKRSGYKLTPVNTGRTGYYKKLQFDYQNNSWKKQNFPEYGYSLLFPAEPFKIEKENSLMYSWTDIGSGINYFSMGTFLKEKTDPLIAELTLKMVVQSLKKSEKIKMTKSEVKTTEDFTEAVVEMEADGFNETKMRYIIKENVLYSIFAEYHKNNEHPEDIERFLNSFRFTEKVETEWKSFTSKRGAFEVFLPQDPKEKLIRSTNNGVDFETRYFTATDVKNGGSCMMRYFDLPVGISYANDSLILKDYSDDFIEGQGKSVTNKDESFSHFLGFPAYDLTVEFDDYTEMKLKTILRGGRIYTMTYSGAKGKIVSEGAGNYFNSFEMKSFLPSKLEKYSVPSDVNFSFLSTSKPVWVKGDSLPGENIKSTWAVLDAGSGTNYYYSIKDLPPFYYAKNDSAFYYDADDLFLKENESVVTSRFVYHGEVKLREFSSRQPNSALTKKVRYFNVGRRIYAVIAMINEIETEKSTQEKIFSSLSYKGPDVKFDFNKNKSKQLLQSLSSEDTSLVRMAKDFLADYNFEVADIPDLESALRKNYSDDADSSGNIRMNLLESLKSFDVSEVSTFIADLLPDLKKFPSLNKKAWLTLLYLRNNSNAKIILTAIKDGKADKKIISSEFMLLKIDSEFALKLFPEIFTYADKEYNWNSLYELTVSISENDKSMADILLKNSEKIFSNLIYQSEHDKTHSAPDGFIKWVSLNDQGSGPLRNYILKLQKSISPEAKLQGLNYAIEYGVDFNSSSLEDIAADKNQRLSLFESLENKGKENLFPKKYYTQQYFSESDLAEWINKSGKTFSKVEFFKETVYEYKGYKQKMFVYKLTYTYNEEEKTAIGFAGPYPLKYDAPVKHGDYTGSTMQDFYPDILEVLIRTHIKKMSQ